MTSTDHLQAGRELDAEVMAAPRDASWWSYPNVRHAKVLHVVTVGSAGSACGNPMLVETMQRAASAVPVHLRCQRSGCRQRWPELCAPS